MDQVFHDLRIGPYAYLRDWTVRRLIDEYGTWILLFALLLLGLIFSQRAVLSQLVRVRTAHLQEALRMSSSVCKTMLELRPNALNI